MKLEKELGRSKIMIKIKDANKNRVLKAKLNSMFTANEYNKMYLELKQVYFLLEGAMLKIESMEKINKSDKSFIQDIENELQNLL